MPECATSSCSNEATRSNRVTIDVGAPGFGSMECDLPLCDACEERFVNPMLSHLSLDAKVERLPGEIASGSDFERARHCPHTGAL